MSMQVVLPHVYYKENGLLTNRIADPILGVGDYDFLCLIIGPKPFLYLRSKTKMLRLKGKEIYLYKHNSNI